MSKSWVPFILKHIALLVILSFIYMVPLSIIYFVVNKWTNNKIKFKEILTILVGLIILSYLAVAIWAFVVSK